MRAQEVTPLLRALTTSRHRQQKQDDDKPEQRTSSSPNATLTLTTPPRTARRRSQSPSLAVIHEGGPAHEHERDSISSFSTSTQDVYENYNALSTQVVWPPEGIPWPPQQYSPTSSSSSSCEMHSI
mmetsp:Transcript_3601/g.6001  ORF Transcript_3601/g.6001 Transcript_3601/m.6001 type:complete len:126 (-) Transcript_3601:11-388(-)